MRPYAGHWNVCADGLECHMLVPACLLVRNLNFHSKTEDVTLSWDTIGFKPTWWRLNVIPQESCYFGTFFLFRIIYYACWLLLASTENIAVICSCVCPVFIYVYIYIHTQIVMLIFLYQLWCCLAYLNRLVYCFHYWFVLRGNYLFSAD
jgi:hypothetical protein